MDVREILYHFNQIKGALSCPLDEGFLEPYLNDDDRVEIYCTSCSFKQVLGLDAQDRIRVMSVTSLTQD